MQGAKLEAFRRGELMALQLQIKRCTVYKLISKAIAFIAAEGMLGEDKELQQEFQQLVKGEIELFKAIAKGEGVSGSFPLLSSLSQFSRYHMLLALSYAYHNHSLPLFPSAPYRSAHGGRVPQLSPWVLWAWGGVLWACAGSCGRCKEGG